MRIRSVIVIAAASLAAGYSLHTAQERIAGFSFSDVEGRKSARTVRSPVEPIYELDEVKANREQFDGRIISVVGAVCMRYSRPYLVPDDDVALLKEFPGEGRYFLSLPEWRFRDMPSLYPGITVTGRFAKLDDKAGFDNLSPIASISWAFAPRGRKHDATIDDQEMKTITNGTNTPAQTDDYQPAN